MTGNTPAGLNRSYVFLEFLVAAWIAKYAGPKADLSALGMAPAEILTGELREASPRVQEAYRLAAANPGSE